MGMGTMEEENRNVPWYSDAGPYAPTDKAGALITFFVLHFNRVILRLVALKINLMPHD